MITGVHPTQWSSTHLAGVPGTSGNFRRQTVQTLTFCYTIAILLQLSAINLMAKGKSRCIYIAILPLCWAKMYCSCS